MVALVGANRLLTLVGPGGTGKTRLALEVASGLLPAYPDGVWLVELAALSEAALVPQALAATLGVREVAGVPLVDALAHELRHRRLALVLDNCEHLVAACARLAEALLLVCPHLHILATSREPLHIPGEVVWPVPPLELPDQGQPLALDDLLGCEAVQLFAQRAQAVAPAFRVTADNAAAVAQVCGRLDGLPLAIELAAACVPTLSVQQVAARLDDRFRLLTGGSRTAQGRHQTLRATLDWSYDLLSEAERLLLRRLAIFAGGWTLEAAEAVCADDGLESGALPGLLMRLVDTSLVVVREEQQGRRYGLLETVRQYALELLDASGERPALAAAHMRWYLALAREASQGLHGPQQAVWLHLLGHERDNLRAALEWGYAQQEGDAGLRLASALYWYWYLSGALSEGRAWFERALERTSADSPTSERASALTGVGAMALYQDDLTTARDHLHASIPLWRERGSSYGLGLALFGLGMVAINQGDGQAAQVALEESLALFEARGARWPYAMALMHLGDVAFDADDCPTARARYEQSLAIQRAIQNTWGIAQTAEQPGRGCPRLWRHRRCGSLL